MVAHWDMQHIHCTVSKSFGPSSVKAQRYIYFTLPMTPKLIKIEDQDRGAYLGLLLLCCGVLGVYEVLGITSILAQC